MQSIIYFVHTISYLKWIETHYVDDIQPSLGLAG